MDGLGSMNYLSINKKDGTMAIAHTSGIVSLWDVRNFDQPLETIQVHEYDCRSVEYSPDGDYLITSSFDGTARIVNEKSHKVVFEIGIFQIF